MKRREFFTLAGGVALAMWPLAVRAQQDVRVRRVGVLMGATDDVEGQRRLAALRQGLRDLKWIEGTNIALEIRWAGGDAARAEAMVKEMVGLAPDLIVGVNSPIMRALKLATQAIPIVFAGLADPVGDGIVPSLARPGGNITGFASFEPGMAGKWLQLLKEIAPATRRVAVVYNPSTAPHSLFWPTLDATAPALGLSLIRATVQDVPALEATIAALATAPGAGLALLPDAFTTSHRKLIYALSERYRVPAVWSQPFHASDGGLIAYGPDFVDQFRRAASYVDRILRGSSTPADLPVQQPIKFELRINLKTAKALGLTVPQILMATADEVIE